MQLSFGIGAIWGTRTDQPGYGPIQFGLLQENTIDISFEVKELYSQLQFPVDIARGKGKITGKAKVARIFGALYGDLFFGEAPASGQTAVAENEVHTLSTTPVTVTNSANYVSDLGVAYDSATGTVFVFTTGTPTTGQYTTGSNGVYTFAAGDAGNTVFISYAYTASGGLTTTITNNFMGQTPTFSLTFYSSQNTLGSSGQLTLRLNECISHQLSFPSKIDDYNIPDFNWQAFAPASNIIGTLSTTE